MSAVNETIGGDVSRVALRRLLRSGAGAEVAELAGDLGRPVAEIAAAVEDMSGQGRLRLDAQGRVTGAAGLSVGPDRHQIEIEGRPFWTWCAYDIMGIFGALRASGLARSTDPLSGAQLEVRFQRGRLLPPTDGSPRITSSTTYEGPSDSEWHSSSSSRRRSRSRLDPLIWRRTNRRKDGDG